MKNNKFSETQIFAILKQGEAGVPVGELCREHGMVIPPFLGVFETGTHAAICFV